MIKDHCTTTQSSYAKNLLDSWEKEKLCFWQIIPKEMIYKFKQPVLIEDAKLA
mgnify:CR=1 FL=1